LLAPRIGKRRKYIFKAKRIIWWYLC